MTTGEIVLLFLVFFFGVMVGSRVFTNRLDQYKRSITMCVEGMLGDAVDEARNEFLLFLEKYAADHPGENLTSVEVANYVSEVRKRLGDIRREEMGYDDD